MNFLKSVFPGMHSSGEPNYSKIFDSCEELVSEEKHAKPHEVSRSHSLQNLFCKVVSGENISCQQIVALANTKCVKDYCKSESFSFYFDGIDGRYRARSVGKLWLFIGKSGEDDKIYSVTANRIGIVGAEWSQEDYMCIKSAFDSYDNLKLLNITPYQQGLNSIGGGHFLTNVINTVVLKRKHVVSVCDSKFVLSTWKKKKRQGINFQPFEIYNLGSYEKKLTLEIDENGVIQSIGYEKRKPFDNDETEFKRVASFFYYYLSSKVLNNENRAAIQQGT